MNISDELFEGIMQALFTEKKRFEALKKENRELHSQFSDLCESRGIFVDILGKRFSLVALAAQEEGIPQSPVTDEAPSAVPPATPITPLIETWLPESELESGFAPGGEAQESPALSARSEDEDQDSLEEIASAATVMMPVCTTQF